MLGVCPGKAYFSPCHCHQLIAKSHSQVYQFLVSCDVDQGLRAGVAANILALKETPGLVFHAAFVEGSQTTGVTFSARMLAAASETDSARHASVGEGGGGMPEVGLLN